MPAPPERLLVVDDEEGVVAALHDYFTVLGYAVDCAASAEAARALLSRREYEAVVTDLRLSQGPRLDGLEVIGCLRSRSADAACVVLTAYADAAHELEARRRGADAYVQKPAPLAVVARTIVEIRLARPKLARR